MFKSARDRLSALVETVGIISMHARLALGADVVLLMNIYQQSPDINTYDAIYT